jgi:hypothetical protein
MTMSEPERKGAHTPDLPPVVPSGMSSDQKARYLRLVDSE